MNSPVTLASLLKSTGISIVYILFAAGLFVFTKNTISYLIESVKIGSFLLHRFMMVLLFMFFVSINIGNIVVSFSTLFKSVEVAWLITKPVSFTKIFLIKFLDNFFYSSTTFLLMIFAALLGYGVYFHMNWLFYPLSLVFIIFPFMFSAGSLGALILLVILRLSGRFGIKKIIIFLAVIYAASLIGFYYASSPVKLVREVFKYYPHINQYFGFLESSLVKLFPNSWVADSFYWISEGKMERALPLIALNISFSLMLSGLTLFTAKKWYYKCWITSLELNSNLKIRNTMNINMLAFENNSILNRMDEMIIKREFLLFFREPTQWLHLAVMIFLMIIFMSGISGIRIIIDDSYYNDLLRTIIYLVVSLFGIFMVAALSLRFIFPLVSLEGETVWKIRSAPVNHKSFLIKRLLIYFAFVFITGQLITFFANHQFPLRLSVIGQINSIFITISIASINFGMGGYFANYKERNPIRLSSSQGASITFLFILAYMVLLIALLFIPVYKFFESEHFSVNAPLGNLAITTAVLFISSIIISFFSIRAGLNSFLRDY